MLRQYREQWNDGYSEIVTCFPNTIKNRDSGTHLTGFRQSLTRTINAYANENMLCKEAKGGLPGEDLHEGLPAVVSIKVGDPKYSNQANDKLVSSEVATSVSTGVESDGDRGRCCTRPRVPRPQARSVRRAAPKEARNIIKINLDPYRRPTFLAGEADRQEGTSKDSPA
jgi:hypothetical protein